MLDDAVGRIPLIDGTVGADSDRYRPRRTMPPTLGSAASALPRLETSLAPSLVEALDDSPSSASRPEPAIQSRPHLRIEEREVLAGSSLVVGALVRFVPVDDPAFLALILNRAITTVGIAQLLSEIVELFLELVGHVVFGVAHLKDTSDTDRAARRPHAW